MGLVHTTIWFLSDPRRLCVLGIWLSLAGLVVTLSSLASDVAIAGLLAGVLLSAAGCWAKVAGRDRFRRGRVVRARASQSLPRAQRRSASPLA
jgi:hypothetical protein